MNMTELSPAMMATLRKLAELDKPVTWDRTGDSSWTGAPTCYYCTANGVLYRFNPRTLRALERRGLLVAREDFLLTTFRLDRDAAAEYLDS
jgi:hypothetical protein